MGDRKLDWSLQPLDMPEIDLDQEIARAKRAIKAFEKILEEVLEAGVDFDKLPGAKKAGLLKPGAEILCQVFHLVPGKTDILSKDEDRETGFLSIVIGTPILHRVTHQKLAYGIGSCSSNEAKYRYRYDEDGSQHDHLNPADLHNTIVKMAAKRSFVGGVLLATGADRIFVAGDADEKIPATKKTINYLKYSFYKGVAKEAMLADIEKIIERKIEKLEDLTQDEASEIIDAKKAAAPQGQPDKKGEPMANDDQLLVIAEEQKRLGWSDEKMSFNLQKHLKVDHPSKLTMKQAESIIKQMQAMEPQQPTAAAAFQGGNAQGSLFS
jgi:hypothetical protein